ncbi:hypothetical protein BVY04_03280 [bacterium M21]|nr:hypothetical protein BVY04_03280 [bacterium M21]
MNTLIPILKQALLDADDKMSMLSGRQISIQDVTFRSVPLNEIGGVFSAEEEVLFGIGMTLIDNPHLRYLMLLTHEGRDHIVSSVAGIDAIHDAPLANSLLEEVGNIFGSTVANFFASSLSRSITTGVPELIADMAGAIISSAMCEFEDIGDQVWLCDVAMFAQDREIDCRILLLFDEELEESINRVNERQPNLNTVTTGGN